MNKEVREEDLPGIGRLYEIVGSYGGVITVVIHHNGRRDLYVASSRNQDPSNVTLSDTEAHTLGSVLNGTYFTPEAVAAVHGVMNDLIIDWASIAPGSPGAGRSIGDLRVRARTGVTILSILRGKALIHEPDAEEVLQPDDRLVVVGRRQRIPEFLHLVVGGG